jgi:DNA-binding CsgD family transcriptional regulator
MPKSNALARGRAAFGQEAWAEACDALTAADAEGPLDPDDLDRLGTAAYLTGADEASIGARTRAHHAWLARGEVTRAARSAFWLAFALLDRPDLRAQAGGWLARARRLLEPATEPCVEHGFLLCASAYQYVGEGDMPAAQAAFQHAAAIGARFRDADLTALARHGEGRALLSEGRAPEGFAILDEVMVGVTCGEVGPMVAGVVYCSVISACHDLFDLRRAQEWTTALAGWCAAHPDMMAFRGSCLVHRSELLQLHGAWQDAIDEAQRACDPGGGHRSTPADESAAWCQQAELHRLRGDFDKADAAYRAAHRAGLKPHPGLALLRLAQGRTAAASAAIGVVLQEARGVRARARALAAAVEIQLGAGDPAAAGAAASELARLAADLDAPFLRATSAQASAAVALADGDAAAATAGLREAWAIWRDLGVPYEVARARALMGLAYVQLGDEEGGRMEVEAAQELFERIGAAPDAARMAAWLAPAPASAGSCGGLTGREIEVLRLIASGLTNRRIAGDLAISEKTVARHVSNIFLKLDLSSRSAATAYAYRHKLL